jgi:hypothetical protein
MGIILNCGVEMLYISLINWAEFKRYILFATLKMIGQIYPSLFIFIDEQFEIFERITNHEGILNVTRIDNFESLKNIHENKVILLQDMYIDYVNTHFINVTNMQLIGIHELFYNNINYNFDTCRNLFTAIALLKPYITISATDHRILNNLTYIFEYSWETKQDLNIL